MKLPPRGFSISSDFKPFGCPVDRLNTSERGSASTWVASQTPRKIVTVVIVEDESVTAKKDRKRQRIVAAALSQKISSVRVTTTTTFAWLQSQA